MSQPARASGAAAPGGNAPAQDGDWMSRFGGLLKPMAMFFAVQMVMRYGMDYMGLNKSAPTSAPPASPDSTTIPNVQSTVPDTVAVPLWPIGTPMSMLLFVSTSPTGNDVDTSSPLLAWDGLTYGNWKEERAADLLLEVPEIVRLHNGTWWIDIVLVKGGGTDLQGKTQEDLVSYRKQLTRFLPKKRVRKEKKLIRGEGQEEEETEPSELPPATIVSHWSSNLTLTIMSESPKINTQSLQPLVVPHIQIVTRPDGPKYYPPVFPNDFWLLRENMLPINDTSYQLPLHVSYAPITNWKFHLFATMTQSFEQAAQQQGGGQEMDEVKRMLTETSPWLLITTAIVTLLHTVFEFLAFSSDIGHWRKKDKDLVGVSLRTILTNCFVQLVILLYLHDSSEETSFMILFGQGIGLLIEAWKITKVVDVRVRPNPNSLLGYSVAFEDKKVLSDDEKKTQEYDKLAFRLVSYFAIPALMGYTVYSLLYETHRGWYSFIITTLAQAIYMFGFVQLVPQLIINYKLKSVAHMPMKAMMYKTLSTVVDDFFAFCIRMPWLHRLACFRDDVVFLILLYQRWIYRVDYSRVNEYGQVAEGKAEPVGDKTVAETKKTQ
ncbi:cleft lip and palate associated transmembrane protein [Tremella mesenterica]|uniref:Cleft lip and palate associated transmembrane protein n=1 Tax=Tremella mesenterica TaxID=5217 RepID=A0A4Q1BTH0_TREME|nr:cleft lip and palate associated transmembrane protein [Tremella mesenterica]